MVQVRRGPCFALEASDLRVAEETRPRYDLDRDPALKGRLLGFVDNPHTAPTDLTNDAVVPETVGRAARRQPDAGAGTVLGVFYVLDRREESPNVLSKPRMLARVFINGRSFPRTQPLRELLGEQLDRMPLVFPFQIRHCVDSSASWSS